MGKDCKYENYDQRSDREEVFGTTTHNQVGAIYLAFFPFKWPKLALRDSVSRRVFISE